MSGPDQVRALTVFADPKADPLGIVVPVRLDVEARVYSIQIVFERGGRAELRLQDSILEVTGTPSDPFRANLPGLHWPASAKFWVVDGPARLQILYGHCKS